MKSSQTIKSIFRDIPMEKQPELQIKLKRLLQAELEPGTLEKAAREYLESEKGWSAREFREPDKSCGICQRRLFKGMRIHTFQNQITTIKNICSDCKAALQEKKE